MEYLVINALGKDQKVIVRELIHLASKFQCNIKDSRMTTLGSHLGIVMMVGGNWSAISKLEAALKSLKKDNLWLEAERTEVPKITQNFLPYLVQVVALDSPGIIYEICEFFNLSNIKINELQSNPFAATYTGTAMVTVTLSISVPAEINLSELRENFMLLCDELNIDGIMEPEKR